MRAHIVITEDEGVTYDLRVEDYSLTILPVGIVLQGRWPVGHNTVVTEDGAHIGHYAVDEKWETRGP